MTIFRPQVYPQLVRETASETTFDYRNVVFWPWVVNFFFKVPFLTHILRVLCRLTIKSAYMQDIYILRDPLLKS